MKIKDTNCFRRGNLIKHDWIDQNGVAHSYIKIQSIVGNSFVSVDSNKLPAYETIMRNDIEVIPISEEILLDFGFSKDENKAFHFLAIEEYNIEMTVNAFSNHEDGEYYISISGYNHQCTFKIRYVHQLQNWYHTLTEKELKLIKS